MIKINPSILSKTVKAITPKTEKVEEAQIRGTIVFHNQEHFVQLDGAPSNALTPIANFAEGASDAGFVHGDRVLVLIKNHQAIVTKNLTTGLQAQAAKEASTFTTAITDEGITAQRIIANDTFTNTLRANNITADEIIAGMATIDTLDANYAHITNGVIDNAKIGVADVNDLSANYAHITTGIIDNAKIDVADVNNLSANYAHITNGVIDNAKIGYADVNDLSANYAHITNGVIDNAKIGYADVDNLSANYAHITNGVIDNAKIGYADVNNLSANYAQIDAANVTALSAQNAWVNKLMVQTGLLAHEGAVFTLDAIQVNAANITAGTLDVNRLIVTVDGQKYLVDIDPSTGTPSYEKLDGNIVEPRTITADKIVAHDITVQEITTENLVGTNGWINLNQGKFFYGNGANYASSTNAIDWNGTTLKIKGDIGDSVIFNNYSTTQEMNTAIGDAVDGIEVGGRNLHKDSANLGSSWALNNATLSNDVATITRTSSTTGEYRIYQMPANGYWSWEPNTEYVVSIEAKGNAGGEELQFLCNGGGTPTYHDANPKLTTSWKRYSRSFKTGSSVSTGSMTYAYGGTGAGSIQLRNPKLEKGTKATDWTPAPEDVQGEIDAKKSVHTLNTSYSYTYANILTYSAEGFNSDWNVTSTDGVKAGDTARLKVTVSNMSNAPVYIIGTVTEVKSATKINMTSHGLDTTIIDGGNILTNSIGANQIKANAITANKIAIGDYNNYVTVTENDASSILPNSGIEIRDGWLYKASASASNAWVSPVLNNWTKAGEKYRVTGIFKTEVAGKVYVYIYGRNADGSAVSGASTITITTTANVEKAMSETITITEAVANCPKVNINVYFRNSSDASVVGYVRRLRVERMSGGELIVDGAVTVGSMSQDAQNKVLNSNIEVGGRNLLGATDNAFLPNGANIGASMTFGSIGRYNSPDSEFSKESYDGSSNSLIVTSTETGNRGVGWYTKKGEVKAGETYTFSCRVKANVATTVHTHTAWRNGSATAGYTGWTAGGNMSISANTWTDYSYTFTPSSSAQLSWEFYVALCFTGATTGVTCRIAHAMLEKGNKATDWSPASGDETGTNLISYPYFRDACSGYPYTVAGVTYTLNKDGTVTAKGTATANAWYSFSLSHYPYAPNGAFGLPAGTYTLSGCPSGGSSTTYRINFAAYSVDDGTTGLGNSVADYGNGATVTLTQPALVRIEALICNGYACPSAGITFKPMLEVGGVAHTFASPTASKAAAEGATNYLHADSNGLRIASADPRTQNQRIQMTSSNIDMYDSGGVKRININSNSGVTVGRSDKGHTVVNDVGLYIYDNSNNKSAQATSAGFEVFDTADNSSAALFGGTSRIGKASGARAVTTSTGLDIYNSSNQKKASYGSTQYIYGGSGTYPLVSVDGTNARLMQSANNYANVNSSGLQIYQSGASVAEFGSSARVGQTSSNNIEISSTAFEVVDADGSTQFSITPATSSTSRTEYHSIGTFSSGATKKFSISKSATAFRIDVYPSSGSSTVGSVSIPASTAGATTSATVGVATITLKRVTAGGRIEATVKANSAIRGGSYSVTSPRRVANITAGGYDLCYTAGDSISGYIWKGASYVTNSKQVIDLTLPINKPILAENVTVSNVQMITRQGNAYTHGSSASSFVAWTVNNYSIEEAGILVAVSRTTTTNATNNSPIGVYLTCDIKFS